MQRLTDGSETTTSPLVIAEGEFASAPAESGQRLAEAQSADREWRETLVLRLHRRLTMLKKAEGLIQGWGAGLGTIVMTTAILLTYGLMDASDVTYGRGLVALIFTVTGFTASLLVLLQGVSWWRQWTRAAISRLGMRETPEATEPAGEWTAGVPSTEGAWVCPECWYRQPETATECSFCTRVKPAVAARTKFRQWRKVAGALGPRLWSALAWLIIILMGLPFALAMLASFSER